VCTACAAGSERLTAGAPLDCAKCGAGFYKDVRGVSSCGRCTNAPANNSLYMIWGNTEATIASCPWYFSFFFWFWCGVAWM
jgi:predicted amidophosphoribosyltransferase